MPGTEGQGLDGGGVVNNDGSWTQEEMGGRGKPRLLGVAPCSHQIITENSLLPKSWRPQVWGPGLPSLHLSLYVLD